MSKEQYLFISHNSLDKSLIDPIAQRLYAEFEIRPWLDKWDIPAAADWASVIEEALRECSACAVFLGANGWGPHHLDEAKLALERKTQHLDFKVIPVLLPGAGAKDISALEDLFKRRHRVDFTTDINDEGAFKRLLSAIRGQAPGPPEETVFTIRRDAKRWDDAPAKNKDSFLYEGGQLEQAQKLAQDHAEQLNDLAVKFLNASAVEEKQRIRSEQRRTRNIITGLIIGSVLILLTAVFAFAQRAEAVNQRAEAVKQAEAAEERRREAVRQTKLAEDALQREQVATKQEKIAKGQAEEKRREAEEASTKERAARVEAEKQRRGAQARQLFAEAELAQITAEGHGDRWAQLGRQGLQLVVTADTLAREVNLRKTAPLDRSVRVVARFVPRSVIEQTFDSELGLDYTADGRLMILVIGEELSLRETHSGKEIGRLPRIEYKAQNSWTPTLSYLAASAPDDQYFRVWRVGEKVEELEGLRQPANVNQSAINSEGTLLVTASDDDVLRVVRLLDGSKLITETYTADITAIATDSPGSLVATTCYEGNIRIYDVQRRELIRNIPTKTEKEPDGFRAASLALSPDGTLLAAANYTTIAIWNLFTGAEIRRIRVLEDSEDDGIQFISFGANGRSVRVYTPEEYVSLYDIGTGAMIWPTSTSSDSWTESGVHWSSRFSSAAFSRIPGGIEVWDSSDGRLVTRAAYEGDFTGAAYNPLTKTVAVTQDRKLRLISVHPVDDLAGGVIRGEEELFRKSAADETFVVRTDMAFGIWSWAMPYWWTPVRPLRTVVDVAVSPDGSRVAAWSEEGLKQWSVDRANGNVQMATAFRFGPQERVLPEKYAEADWKVSLNYSSGGRYLSALANGRCYMWDVATGQQVLSGSYADAVSIDSGERAVWYIRIEGEQTALWSQPLAPGAGPVAERRVLDLPSRLAWFSPNGSYLLYRTRAFGKVTMWDLLEQRHALEAPYDVSSAPEFSEDEGLVAFRSKSSIPVTASSSVASIYDSKSARLVATIKHDWPVGVIAFSGDGSTVATVHQVAAFNNVATIRLTNLRIGKAVGKVAHTGEVHGMALSHDGRRLCVYGKIGAAHVWDISVPQAPVELAQIQHATRVRRAAFDRAARRLTTIEADNTTTKTHKWVISSDELMNRIRRNLSGTGVWPRASGGGATVQK